MLQRCSAVKLQRGFVDLKKSTWLSIGMGARKLKFLAEQIFSGKQSFITNQTQPSLHNHTSWKIPEIQSCTLSDPTEEQRAALAPCKKKSNINKSHIPLVLPWFMLFCLFCQMPMTPPRCCVRSTTWLLLSWKLKSSTVRLLFPFMYLSVSKFRTVITTFAIPLTSQEPVWVC